MARKRKMEISPERVMQELAAIGYARASDYLSVRGNELIVRPTEELPPEQASAIASIERTNSGFKLKFYDKLKALELLGKCMGMFDGNGAGAEEKTSNLLEAIVAGTKGVISTDDIPEIQQAAKPGHDLVEPPGAKGL